MYRSICNLFKRMRNCFYDVHKWLDDVAFGQVVRNAPKRLRKTTISASVMWPVGRSLTGFSLCFVVELRCTSWETTAKSGDKNSLENKKTTHTPPESSFYVWMWKWIIAMRKKKYIYTHMSLTCFWLGVRGEQRHLSESSRSDSRDLLSANTKYRKK